MRPPDAAVVAAWVAGTRAAQGLAPTLTDSMVIARIVDLVGQARQTGAIRSGSKVARPGTAGRITARSRTADTIER
jgi:hypothetical protein